MALRLATAAQNAMADALDEAVNAGAGVGTIKIYTGSQPASANDVVGGATLLATFNLLDPAFSAASSGTCTLNGTPLSTTGAAAGTAGWFRCETSTPGTVFDGSVGTSGQQLNLNTTTISVGVSVQITSGSITMPAS